ncbi:MAG: L-histidine Nalpha-methyltransferase [Solirubrobacteraceae bacterium]|nr:L-histidine Nalpha-methyltransferase [Solirubrobacteraceae bacterium]
MTTTAVQITSRLGPGDERTLAEDVLDGLTRPAKELPSKHFYDAHGSELFERITELPEYYPTRTERWILDAIAGEIAERTRARELVELGAGYATKTRVLLDALAAAGTLRSYVPLDVSEATVLASAAHLVEEYPGLQVHGVIGDFERHLDALPEPAGPRIVALLGGTVGNFLPGARRRFLRTLRRQLGPDDRLLLGTDLVKDPHVIEAAYDDSMGVTAAFNLNILRVCNRELAADFDLDLFEHVAFYHRRHQWIEMRLRAVDHCTVNLKAIDLQVAFAAREEMRTELSMKFTRERLEADLAAAGMALESFHTDPQRLFAVSLWRPVAPY